MNRQVLASDMDGTFIPLEGNAENRKDLIQLSLLLEQRRVELIYVTGRHLEIVLDAIESEGLPRPDWLICDVGTSIYRRAGRHQYDLVEPYAHHLQEKSGELERNFVESLAESNSVELQEEAKQGRFKRSFYCDAAQLHAVTNQLHQNLKESQVRYHIVESVDPFTGRGLIDLLPRGVTKAHALSWWVAYRGFHSNSVMFAGDSGNDLAALISGYRAIVVGNADRKLAMQIAEHHEASGWNDRLFLATKPATSGVLEGVRHFLCDQSGE